jgi:hypothetical protein
MIKYLGHLNFWWENTDRAASSIINKGETDEEHYSSGNK